MITAIAVVLWYVLMLVITICFGFSGGACFVMVGKHMEREITVKIFGLSAMGFTLLFWWVFMVKIAHPVGFSLGLFWP